MLTNVNLMFELSHRQSQTILLKMFSLFQNKSVVMSDSEKSDGSYLVMTEKEEMFLRFDKV